MATPTVVLSLPTASAPLHFPSLSRLTSPSEPIGSCRPGLSPSRSISCGPRDNRGPLIRGRTLSTEAILAVQALKRAAAASASGDVSTSQSRVDEVVSKIVARLIKSDLLAALAELQRQGHCRLALKVFVAMRREIWYRPKLELAACAQMVAALARDGMATEIDVLVTDLLEELQKEGDQVAGDLRGLARLMKALIAAGKEKAVKAVYSTIKRLGIDGDEYYFNVVSKGLRRLGEGAAAVEVERDFAMWCNNGAGIRKRAVRGKEKKNKEGKTLTI